MKKEEPKKEISEIKSLFNYGFLFLLVCIATLIFFIVSEFNYANCENLECFNSNLEKCSKATFVGGNEMIFEYKIFGLSDGRCNVNVKFLQGELTNSEAQEFAGKEMVCSLPKGVEMLPESNLGNCHGLLKEELQDQIITKFHSYLVENLGRINLEILDVSKELLN